jgi:transcriptional regulator with XRE-family HTH domain
MSSAKIRTMEEFAALSGFSRPTVSKYFNDPGSVRASTRARIEEALERYDYRLNFYAMNQNRQLTKNVGILVPYLADPFFAEIARRIERRCIAAGYVPTLFSAHGDAQLEVDILDTIRALKPAGALLAPLGRASEPRGRVRMSLASQKNPVGIWAATIERCRHPHRGHRQRQKEETGAGRPRPAPGAGGRETGRVFSRPGRNPRRRARSPHRRLWRGWRNRHPAARWRSAWGSLPFRDHRRPR